MTFLHIYDIAAVLCGLLFLATSFFLARQADQYIPKAILTKWYIMEAMILFFLVGYILFLVIIAKKMSFPTDLITSTIFPGGSMFVLLVINVSKITIKNIRESEHQLFDMNQELNQAYESTVEGWGLALELRDEETEGHTQRVTKLTVQLARQFGVPDEELTNIRRGALLHDIGKIAVPDSILMKKGELSRAERKEIEKHSEHAHTILANIDYLKPACDIPYCHHERWDGTGYPRGLRGEEIPLGARIFAVADVWDALIHERRYHPAWSTKKVCDHMKAGSGSHFDPKVIKSFLELELCEDTGQIKEYRDRR